MLWQKNVNERLKTILCVSLSARYPTPPAGVDVILKICWFVLNPKQADLPTPLPPCISAHKQPPPHPLSLAGWKDGPENPPQFDSSRVGHVGRAGWLRCSGSLRPTSVVLSHLPTKREGELHSEGPEGGMSRSAGENPRICRVVRLNESHHHGGSLCQELPQANNVACGGAD